MTASYVVVIVLEIDQVTNWDEATETGVRIRRAAVSLFAARGYAATGIRDIADLANVTPAALYHYMGSKQGLLCSIMRDGMMDLAECARAAIVTGSGPRAELVSLARAHVIHNGENLLKAYVADTEIRSLDGENRDLIVSLRDSYESLWADVITRGVEAEEFRGGNLKMMRFTVIQLCNSIIFWYSPDGPLPLSAIADEMAQYVLAIAGCEAEDGSRQTSRPTNGHVVS